MLFKLTTTQFRTALVLLLFTFSAYIQSNAQSFCFVDVSGYVWSIDVTPLGGTKYALDGFLSRADIPDWSVSGKLNNSTGSFFLTAVNPLPDGCVDLVDSFTYFGTRVGPKDLDFTWENYCFGAVLSPGTSFATINRGACPTDDLRQHTFEGGATSTGNSYQMETFIAPNPVQSAALISYSVKKEEQVVIEVFNSNGQLVESLLNTTQSMGAHTHLWDASLLPDGLYFYRINGVSTPVLVQH